jgi:transposase
LRSVSYWSFMQAYENQLQDPPGDGGQDASAQRRVTMAGIFRVPDAMWERIEPLIPPPAKVHRFGGGARRIPDRVVFDAIFFVLRTGCQWHALDVSGICSGATAHRRFQEWEQAGLFDALWVAALEDYDRQVGLDWSWLSIDGSMGKARWEAGVRARTRPIAASSGSSAA